MVLLKFFRALIFGPVLRLARTKTVRSVQNADCRLSTKYRLIRDRTSSYNLPSVTQYFHYVAKSSFYYEENDFTLNFFTHTRILLKITLLMFSTPWIFLLLGKLHVEFPIKKYFLNFNLARSTSPSLKVTKGINS